MQRSPDIMKISVILFFYNESQNLPTLQSRCLAVAAMSADEFEWILVDDCSRDNSDALARDWLRTTRNCTYIRFAKNFGSHAAVAAGLKHCSGDCAVIMAADLQDPPELIPDLVHKYREGYDVVWACRSDRPGESWRTKAAAAVYWRLMKWLGLPNAPPMGADFLLVSRKVVTAVNGIPEKHTSVIAMILWMGFPQSFIQYVKQKRFAGVSKWTLARKIKIFVDSVVSFSYGPIRLASVVGVVMACGGITFAIVLVGLWLVGRVASGTGYAAIMSVLLTGQGLILLTLGILGEYLWRTYDEARGRPRFIIDDVKRSPESSD
jgi:dolichol-phosphate mannosyltransferase